MGAKAADRYHSPLLVLETTKKAIKSTFHKDPPCPIKSEHSPFAVHHELLQLDPLLLVLSTLLCLLQHLVYFVTLFVSSHWSVWYLKLSFLFIRYY